MLRGKCGHCQQSINVKAIKIQVSTSPQSICRVGPKTMTTTNEHSSQQPIRWYQNIPVISWLMLRGKCGHCQHPISIRYPAIELLSQVVAEYQSL
jgi:prepilin signal peptidase PulO-like enzyme (type II secretory pathway)